MLGHGQDARGTAGWRTVKLCDVVERDGRVAVLGAACAPSVENSDWGGNGGVLFRAAQIVEIPGHRITAGFRVEKVLVDKSAVGQLDDLQIVVD